MAAGEGVRAEGNAEGTDRATDFVHHETVKQRRRVSIPLLRLGDQGAVFGRVGRKKLGSNEVFVCGTQERHEQRASVLVAIPG
jgi:hypothetical protein